VYQVGTNKGIRAK